MITYNVRNVGNAGKAPSQNDSQGSVCMAARALCVRQVILCLYGTQGSVINAGKSLPVRKVKIIVFKRSKTPFVRQARICW